jgi:multidrug efflux system membrane fusion protein
MKTAGAKKAGGRAGKLVAAGVVAGALAIGGFVLHGRAERPSTHDATIDADVVHVAAAVGGRIIAIPVTENSRVIAGDLLFQIDPKPYQFAVDQARADLVFAEAARETQRRAISTQRSVGVIAADQILRAQANLKLASNTVERLRPLASKGYISIQQFDQAQTAQRDAETSLRQAREQQVSAVRAVDTDAGGSATIAARRATLAIAERALQDTTVRASEPGRVVGLTVQPGEMLAPSQSLFTLVTSDEWFAVGNFREVDLGAIKVGDCATVYSMIDRRRAIRGVVQGIGSGVIDTDRINLPRSPPYVERSLSWVRVSQRFPVRIRLQRPPQDLMRLGATAIVEVKHGDACR